VLELDDDVGLVVEEDLEPVRNSLVSITSAIAAVSLALRPEGARVYRKQRKSSRPPRLFGCR